MATAVALPQAIQPGITLGTSATTIATVPTSTQFVVRSAVFSNASGSAVSISVNHTPAGGGSFVIIPLQAISADNTYVSSELAGLVLNSGDTLTATCSAGTAVNCFISGFSVV